MNIAVVAETAPAKTIIPIIEKLDCELLSLTHSEGAMELLSPYSTEIAPIGEGRRNTSKKRNSLTIGRLVLEDTYRTYKLLKPREIDMLITCGNAGDVRKGTIAAKRLKIPRIHIEQDIYNPIEMIAYSNLITVPSTNAQKKLKKLYGIENTYNIRGYPQAEYVSKYPLEEIEKVHLQYNTNDYYVLFLGGDTNASQIPKIIKEMERLDKTVLIVPFRFKESFVEKFITKSNIQLIKGYVDLLSLINASQGVIYCAGMGLTIELGVLSIPAVKIMGFHREHASNDLAQQLGIEIVHTADIAGAVSRMKKPSGKQLVKNGIKASFKVAELITNFDMFSSDYGGFSSMRRIWNQRKQYR